MENLEEKENSYAFAIDEKYAGMIAVADTIKETSKEAIQVKRNGY